MVGGTPPPLRPMCRRSFLGTGATIAVVPGMTRGQEAEGWTYEYDASRLTASPTVVDGTVYTHADDGSIHAVDLETGTREWIYEEDDARPVHRITVVDGSCFVADSRGVILEIDARTGSLLSSLEIGEDRLGPPTVTNGRCFVQHANGLEAIDIYSHESIWSDDNVPNPGPLQFGGDRTPSISAGICCACGPDQIRGFDAESGDLRWEQPVQAAHDTSPVIDDSRVWVTETRGVDRTRCLEFDLERGTLTRTYQFDRISDAPMTPVIYDNSLILTGEDSANTFGMRNGVVARVAREGDNAKVVGQISVKAEEPPTIAGETIIICRPKEILAIKIDSDEKYTLGSPTKVGDTYSAPLVANGTVIVASGELTARTDIVEDDAMGARGYHPVSGHHEGWAEQAAIEVTDLQLTVEDTHLEPEGETQARVEATVESDRTYDVTERATLSSADPEIATVGDSGWVVGWADGDVELTADLYGETAATTLTVVDASEADPASDDGSPGPGVVGVAAAIGGATWLSSRLGHRSD